MPKRDETDWWLAVDLGSESEQRERLERAIEDFAQGEAYGEDPLKARMVEDEPPSGDPHRDAPSP